MKKKHADEWVKALRSGKYKQGYNQLYDHDDKSYCCLGVLNKLHKNQLNDNYTGILSPGNGVIGSDSGYLPSLDVSLIKLNDDLRLNFDEIADIIQICYKEL